MRLWSHLSFHLTLVSWLSNTGTKKVKRGLTMFPPHRLTRGDWGTETLPFPNPLAPPFLGTLEKEWSGGGWVVCTPLYHSMEKPLFFCNPQKSYFIFSWGRLVALWHPKDPFGKWAGETPWDHCRLRTVSYPTSLCLGFSRTVENSSEKGEPL